MSTVVANKDLAAEQGTIEEFTKAMLNILEDMLEEKERLEETQRAMVNILNDAAEEKALLEDTQKAVLNILDDSVGEKALTDTMQKAVLNILEDFSSEKDLLEDTQRAVLNILEDFDVERNKSETANLELREVFEAQRRAKEAADSANRELEAFSYSVSHDLRAPLRAIDGFSKTLLDGYQNLLDERGRDYLRRVRNATQKMAQLIDDLLKLSRLTRGDLNKTSVDLSLLAGEVAAELRRLPDGRRVSFLVADGLVAQCDQHLIKVVLDNLLGNAWKFTGKKEEAHIEFGSTLIDGTQTYFIRDNGAGFDMAFSDKLFDTFQRLHLEREFPGTGIGLSLVQRIIRRHGGKVWAEGEVGKGATFYFTLTSTYQGDES
jgi:light-regulated signal transduction histidine kinase (bacteriophytochrome)